MNLLEKLVAAKLPIASAAIAISFVQISLGWASINVSRALLFKSKRIKSLIPGDSAKDQAMLLSLLERLLTIIVVIATLASLMVTFGVSTAAVGALLGGAGIGIGFGMQQISQKIDEKKKLDLRYVFFSGILDSPTLHFLTIFGNKAKNIDCVKICVFR